MNAIKFLLTVPVVLVTACTAPENPVGTAVDIIGVASPMSWFTADVASGTETLLSWEAPTKDVRGLDLSHFSDGITFHSPSYLLERRESGEEEFTVLARDFALTSYRDTDISPDKSYEYRISCQWEPNDYGTPSYYAGLHEDFSTYNTRQYTTISVSLTRVDFTGSLRDWKTQAAISGASITLVKPDDSEFSLGSEKKNTFVTTSGSDGSFAFNDLYQGVYRLHITNENYADTLVQVFGIYHDMAPFIAYQNPLSDSYTGRADPLELTVKGIFPGYTDNGNGITYAGITHVGLESSAAVLYDYQSVYVDIGFPPEAEGDYGEIYTNWKLGTDSMLTIVKNKNEDGPDYSWFNSGLSDEPSGHFLISLFANGDDGSPLTQLSYPVKIDPGE